MVTAMFAERVHNIRHLTRLIHESQSFTTSVILIQTGPLHATQARRGRYSSYSFLTSALDVSERSGSRPGRVLSPGKEPCYPSDRRVDGPQSSSGHKRLEENPSPLRGIESRSSSL
jgi:hypothetical protein